MSFYFTVEQDFITIFSMMIVFRSTHLVIEIIFSNWKVLLSSQECLYSTQGEYRVYHSQHAWFGLKVTHLQRASPQLRHHQLRVMYNRHQLLTGQLVSDLQF